MLTPALVAVWIKVSTADSGSIMKWVMGWRMMEYKAIRMGKGKKLQRQPLMGLTPSSS